MTDDQVDESTRDRRDGRRRAPRGTPQYGVGPFSVREVALVGVWLLAFIVSFFSDRQRAGDGPAAVRRLGLDERPRLDPHDRRADGRGLPDRAAPLLARGIRRVGSLGIDQFASVAFSVSAVVWLTLLWRNVAVAIESSVWIYGWVVWVEFFLMLAGVVLTVLAPFIPPFAEDFADRREIPAHRNARPVRAVSPRPARAAAPRAEESDEDAAAFVAGAGRAYAQRVTPSRRTPNRHTPSSATGPTGRVGARASARHVRAGRHRFGRLRRRHRAYERPAPSRRSGRSRRKSATSSTTAACRSSASGRPPGRSCSRIAARCSWCATRTGASATCTTCRA